VLIAACSVGRPVSPRETRRPTRRDFAGRACRARIEARTLTDAACAAHRFEAMRHSMPSPQATLPRALRRVSAGAFCAAAAILVGCVVVPIDPRTGQPMVYAPAGDGAPAAPALPVMTAPGPTSLSARLYPLNELAGRHGALSAMVLDQHGGRGRFSVSYGGEMLQGEATRVQPGYAAYGRLHDQVLGPAPRSYGGQRGIANAASANGTSLQCEYLLTAPGQGTGVCLFSDGARYQLHFGS
jgi:hypothetical protein